MWVVQALLIAGFWAFVLYILGHDLHAWAARLLAGGFCAVGTVLGFFHNQWRGGDRLAPRPFFAGLALMITGLVVGGTGGGTTYQYIGAGIEAAGAIAAPVIYALALRADRT
jgi:hypothetical protein